MRATVEARFRQATTNQSELDPLAGLATMDVEPQDPRRPPERRAEQPCRRGAASLGRYRRSAVIGGQLIKTQSDTPSVQIVASLGFLILLAGDGDQHPAIMDGAGGGGLAGSSASCSSA